MTSAVGILPELRIAMANFGSGGFDRASGNRERWEKTVSALRAWQPHIVLCQEISALTPGGLRAHLWATANALGMIPLLGPPTPLSLTGNHPAILISASAGLAILDHGPAATRPDQEPSPPGARRWSRSPDGRTRCTPTASTSPHAPARNSDPRPTGSPAASPNSASWPSPEATGTPTAAPT